MPQSKSLSHELWKTVLPAVVLLAFFELALRGSQKSAEFLMGLGIFPLVSEFLAYTFGFVLINVPLLIAEKFFPAYNRTGRHEYWAGVRFWFASISFAFFWSKVAIVIGAQVGIKPLFEWTLDTTSHTFLIASAIVTWMLVFDLFYYWFHRFQHTIPLLWRFHRVHHSIVEMNCVTSYHHLLEDLLRYPFITLPLAMIFKLDAPQLMFLSAVITVWGQYIHADTAINFGKLHVLMIGTANHRLHHSPLQRYFNKNYSAFFTIWDRIFGTYQNPEGADISRTGLTDLEPPKSLVEFAMMPFRK